MPKYWRYKYSHTHGAPPMPQVLKGKMQFPHSVRVSYEHESGQFVGRHPPPDKSRGPIRSSNKSGTQHPYISHGAKSMGYTCYGNEVCLTDGRRYVCWTCTWIICFPTQAWTRYGWYATQTPHSPSLLYMRKVWARDPSHIFLACALVSCMSPGLSPPAPSPSGVVVVGEKRIIFFLWFISCLTLTIAPVAVQCIMSVCVSCSRPRMTVAPLSLDLVSPPFPLYFCYFLCAKVSLIR